MYDTSHELYWSYVIRVPSKQQTEYYKYNQNIALSNKQITLKLHEEEYTIVEPICHIVCKTFPVKQCIRKLVCCCIISCHMPLFP